MHTLEEGILHSSEIYFLTPSAFALQTLFCIQHIGIFHCDIRYRVTHPYWESILLLFMDEGELEVTFRDQVLVAQKDDIILINCREPHSYRAIRDLSFHYFHFTGPCSLPYAKQIYRMNQSVCIRGAEIDILNHIFSNLFHIAKGQDHLRHEHRMSVYIHMILCELVEHCSGTSFIANESIRRAIQYMEAHVEENISMDALANHVNLSKFYFNRYFKKCMGITPHQYFMNMRIQHAKQRLATSHDPIESIAEQCGFDNPSNFIRTFKQKTGMTPTAFRKIPF